MGLGRRLGVVGIDVVCWGAERGVNIALVSDTSQRPVTCACKHEYTILPNARMSAYFCWIFDIRVMFSAQYMLNKLKHSLGPKELHFYRELKFILEKKYYSNKCTNDWAPWRPSGLRYIKNSIKILTSTAGKKPVDISDFRMGNLKHLNLGVPLYLRQTLMAFII